MNSRLKPRYSERGEKDFSKEYHNVHLALQNVFDINYMGIVKDMDIQ